MALASLWLLAFLPVPSIFLKRTPPKSVSCLRLPLGHSTVAHQMDFDAMGNARKMAPSALFDTCPQARTYAQHTVHGVVGARSLYDLKMLLGKKET